MGLWWLMFRGQQHKGPPSLHVSCCCIPDRHPTHLTQHLRAETVGLRRLLFSTVVYMDVDD